MSRIKLPAALASFRFSGFRILWLSTLTASSGQYAFMVAINWIIFLKFESTTLVGTAVFASMIPGVIVGPFIGVIADRFDRRMLLTLSYALSASSIGGMILGFSLGTPSPWIIIAIMFLLGTSLHLQITCTNSLLPKLVPAQGIFNAAALQGSVQHGSNFFGSGIASWIMPLFGPIIVFCCSMVLFITSAVQSFRIRIAKSETAAGPLPTGSRTLPLANMFKPILEGFKYIGKSPKLRNLMLMVGGHCFLTMSYMSILPEHVHHHLSGGSDIYSMLTMFIGLGSIIGTLGIASVTGAHGQRLLYLITAIGSGLSLVMLAVVEAPLLMYIGGVLVGGTQAAFMAINLSFVLSETNEEYRGRVTSVNFIIGGGSMALGNFIYGAISDVIPPQTSMLITGLCFAFIAAVVMLYGGTSNIIKKKSLDSAG